MRRLGTESPVKHTGQDVLRNQAWASSLVIRDSRHFFIPGSPGTGNNNDVSDPAPRMQDGK